MRDSTCSLIRELGSSTVRTAEVPLGCVLLRDDQADWQDAKMRDQEEEPKGRTTTPSAVDGLSTRGL